MGGKYQISYFHTNVSYTESRLKAYTVLDLGLIFTVSLGPRASKKVESHASFTASKKVSKLTFFGNTKHKVNLKHFQLTLNNGKKTRKKQ